MITHACLLHEVKQLRIKPSYIFCAVRYRDHFILFILLSNHQTLAPRIRSPKEVALDSWVNIFVFFCFLENDHHYYDGRWRKTWVLNMLLVEWKVSTTKEPTGFILHKRIDFLHVRQVALVSQDFVPNDLASTPNTKVNVYLWKRFFDNKLGLI